MAIKILRLCTIKFNNKTTNAVYNHYLLLVNKCIIYNWCGEYIQDDSDDVSTY